MDKEDYTIIILNNNTGQFKIMQMSETINTHAKTLIELDNLQKENDLLRNRLQHLLLSEFICKYDEKDIKTHQYKLKIENADKYLEELENKSKEISFYKQSATEQIKVLLSKYWLTHTNDEVFETFKCNYVPNMEYQEKARQIVDIPNLDLTKAIGIDQLNKNIIKNLMYGATSYEIN